MESPVRNERRTPGLEEGARKPPGESPVGGGSPHLRPEPEGIHVYTIKALRTAKHCDHLVVHLSARAQKEARLETVGRSQ